MSRCVKLRNPHMAMTLVSEGRHYPKATINFVEGAPANIRLGRNQTTQPGKKIKAIGACTATQPSPEGRDPDGRKFSVVD